MSQRLHMLVASTFPEMSRPVAMNGRDGPQLVCTSNEDFDNAYLHLRTV